MRVIFYDDSKAICSVIDPELVPGVGEYVMLDVDIPNVGVRNLKLEVKSVEHWFITDPKRYHISVVVG